MQVSLKTKSSATKSRHSVSDVVGRLARIKKLDYVATYGDFLGAAITRLADDAVRLDHTEQLLIELKRRRVITGRKMVQKLGQHLKEINARA
jgi:hypothetical protein